MSDLYTTAEANMRTITVYDRQGEEIDTIFWSDSRDSLEEIKGSLIDHDGYDWDIEVEEEFPS